MPVIAQFARLFLADAVTQLTDVHGVRQFLDIGTGLTASDRAGNQAKSR